MLYRYTKWNRNIDQRLTMDRLSNLFTHLLTQANGDVDKALNWMEYLGEKYGFFNGDVALEDFKQYLKDRDLVRQSDKSPALELTSRGEQKIRTDAFEEIFSSLKKDSIVGGHKTPYAGAGGEQLPETREFQFGDLSSDINYTRSIQNAVKNHGLDAFTLEESDVEVFGREQSTLCATMLLVDISHSMILYGEDRITPAKKVAMALAEFIKTRYPKDTLDVGVFGDDAQLVATKDLPYISVGPYHTNTKAGLALAQKVLGSRKQANKQVFMITDGKPSAIFERGFIYKNPFGLDPKIVNQTINEAVQCRRKGILITTFMITSDLQLKNFVDRLTQANKGRAYFADLDNLGSFVVTDYLRNRKKKI